MTLQARLSEIDEADVRAYCTGEKPVARVVILALERVVEYARNGDHEKMRLTRFASSGTPSARS
jgi:hypothetical protein